MLAPQHRLITPLSASNHHQQKLSYDLYSIRRGESLDVTLTDAELRQDRYRLPEGMRRVAYDADTQRYTFRDHSGQLYQSAPGEEFGVLRPVTAPLPHRRNVTITEIPDPALRRWSSKPAKTFSDILPSGYIGAAQSAEPTSMSGSTLASASVSALKSPTTLVQAAIPKVQGVVNIVRRRTTLGWAPPPAAWGSAKMGRSESVREEKRRLLEDGWEVVGKEEVQREARIARSKSEMRPSRRYVRK